MQIRCGNCIYDEQETLDAVGACNCCENFSSFAPTNCKAGQPYLVRVSELRYGEVTVWANSEDEAKKVARDAEINFYDSEITDMTAERLGASECPLGGDAADDCAKCAYSGDFHFENGDCVSRKESNSNE